MTALLPSINIGLLPCLCRFIVLPDGTASAR